MKQLKWTLCIAAALLFSACGNSSQTAAPGSSAEAAPPASADSTEPDASPASPDEPDSSPDAAAPSESGADGEIAEADPAQALYRDFFAAELQWQGTYLSGDEQYQLGSEAPYDTAETRYAYTVTPEGAVQRQILHRDADLGNWRSQSEEPLPAALTGVSEAAAPYGLPSPASGGKLFLIQNHAVLVQGDENGENLVKLYESGGTLSNLTPGDEIVYFIENQDTLCRLHLASGVVDKMALPETAFSRFVPISNFTVQVYGQAGDSYLLNLQTRESRAVTAAEIDEMGNLRYEIGQ